VPSLGASGCVFGVFTYLMTMYPDARLELLFFLPVDGQQALLLLGCWLLSGIWCLLSVVTLTSVCCLSSP
jgi:membrane associated rhomboid family serine protease